MEYWLRRVPGTEPSQGKKIAFSLSENIKFLSGQKNPFFSGEDIPR